MTVSKSPGRMTFQKEKYIERCKEEGNEPDPAYLEMYENFLERYDSRFETEESKAYSMEYDLLTTPWILEKVRNKDSYAQNLYAAMCNNEFQRAEMWPILTDQKWSCSWRYAGGIIADMRQEGDYINWYCSGMGGLNQEFDNKETNEQWQARTGYVPESAVTEEIKQDLRNLGWIVVEDKNGSDL
jgi:hypothetical protein